jgi:ATP-dependent Clp protease ATP-binding subunit ClpC
MYEKFTDRARKVMQQANLAAQRFNHPYIGSEHILLGVVEEGTGIAAFVLGNFNADLRWIHMEVEKLMRPEEDIKSLAKLPHTPLAKKILENSIEEARMMEQGYVGSEHLLLSLLREPDGIAAQVLSRCNLQLDSVRAAVLQLTSGSVKNDAKKMLSAFWLNLIADVGGTDDEALKLCTALRDPIRYKLLKVTLANALESLR